MKILVIEDDSIVAMHIEQTIQEYGHTVVGIAGNAKSAEEIAKEHRLDLIVSDINIDGEVSGIECCRSLQKVYDLPVILISAYNDMSTLKSASTLNFVGYLIKPFREDELKTLLDVVVLRISNGTKVQRREINAFYSYCTVHQTLYRDDSVVDLTQKEKSFLEALIQANGAIVPYDSFAYSIWEGEEVSDEARRQLVYRLRNKLSDFPLKLVKGVGYKLEIN